MMKTLESCVAQLGKGLNSFPWQERAAYADWLTQTFFYVRHSTRLLAAAAARFPQDDAGDVLHHRFARHMAEEKRHERLALHDLKQIGWRTTELVERPSTRLFYECQYYKVEHIDPAALFGYILALEAMSAAHGPAAYAAASAAHGSNAATFLKLHSQDDQEHTKEALIMLEQLSAASRAEVERNLEQSTFGYLLILRDISGSA